MSCNAITVSNPVVSLYVKIMSTLSILPLEIEAESKHEQEVIIPINEVLEKF